MILLAAKAVAHHTLFVKAVRRKDVGTFERLGRKVPGMLLGGLEVSLQREEKLGLVVGKH